MSSRWSVRIYVAFTAAVLLLWMGAPARSLDTSTPFDVPRITEGNVGQAPFSEWDSSTDQVFESNGVRLVCDPKSFLYLNGTQVDFEESLMGRGFKFGNPNANKTCGCGESFSV